jgi:MoxR-like ATPase
MTYLTVDRNELEGILPSIVSFYDKDWGKWRKQAVVLIGPPGTGKTSLIFSLARHPKMLERYNELTELELEEIPVYTTSCHPDATAPEVFGQYLPLDGKWTFIPGSMLRAWGYKWHRGHVANIHDGYDADCETPPPGIHLLDDIHLMGPGGQAAMYKSMDNGKGGNFLDPWGQTTYPHPAALVMGTMNGEIDSLDPAVQDRTAVKAAVMEPSTVMLDALDEDMRELCEADYTNNMDPVATYREWQSISLLRPVVGLGKAALLALGKPERAKALIEAMARIGIPEAKTELKAMIAATPA